MQKLFLASLCLLAGCLPLHAETLDCRPETWFHIIGGNASKSGLTADLTAIQEAGFGGIQFFHGQLGEAEAWDGVAEQIPCLSEKWDDLVYHAASECKRLGLQFKMQNCPGWSMSGGPWIAPSNAMRKLAFSRQDVSPGDTSVKRLSVPEIPVPFEYRDDDSDWHDVCYLAFPTPNGGALPEPLAISTNGNCRIITYEHPVVIRTIELPSPSQLNHGWAYNPDVRVIFEAKVGAEWRKACDVCYPQGCWQDRVPFSVACEEMESREWRLSFSSSHKISIRFVRFSSEARLDNYEGLSAQVLRGHLKRTYPMQSRSAYIPESAVRVVKIGDALPDGAASRWTVLRIGHVNMKKKNAPAPKEATGWECDKLDSRGIEANFAGYIGRLADGPLKDGLLNGMIVDSWECERQTWTWRMEEWFATDNGYDVKSILPAIFGWVIESPERTEKVLLDWRRTISHLVTKNYYGRMAQLAHEKGLSVAYETAFGDVVPGDILEYWKHCDIPMCEFWQPYAPKDGGASHPNFKPVRPCVSAAHLYGKRRVDCESFTSMRLTWDENFRDLKEQAVRHFSQGVTHLVFHTFTHNPQTDGRVPGTSFGSYIGTPFVRGQTWWPFMRSFTGWITECCAFLERGLPVVDVLRYLGDEIDHKPDELEYFPKGFKNDYLNADVLFNRLEVRDGRFVLPDGMSYSVIWVPDSVMLSPDTRRRLEELSAKGGRVHFGSADGAVVGLTPQVEICAKSELLGGVLWYHRFDGNCDSFFVAGNDKGFSGKVAFRTVCGKKSLHLELAPYETMLLEFSKSGARDVSSGVATRDFSGAVRSCRVMENAFRDWKISFPSGWGTPESIILGRLVPWTNMPGLTDEGRAYSGTATYTTELNLQDKPDGELMLDLGDVRDFARVYLNGKEVASLWAAPYRCDVSRYVNAGRNILKVEVTSTWFNRLSYDYRQPLGKRKTWTVWHVKGRVPPCLKPKAELRPSGMLGPVRMWISR